MFGAGRSMQGQTALLHGRGWGTLASWGLPGALALGPVPTFQPWVSLHLQAPVLGAILLVPSAHRNPYPVLGGSWELSSGPTGSSAPGSKVGKRKEGCGRKPTCMGGETTLVLLGGGW